MRRYFSFLVIFSCTLCAKPTLRVSNDLWPPHYTTMAGNGLYQEIVRQVYPQYEVEFLPANYRRSKNLVKNGEADLWLGSYEEEEGFALYPQTPFDFDSIVAVFKRGRYDVNGSLDQFNRAMATWLTEYDFHQYFQRYEFEYYEAESTEIALTLVTSGKVDLFLEDETDLLFVLQQKPDWQQNYAMVFIQDFGLYPGFSATEKSIKLVEQWDENLQKMIKDGRLQALFSRYNEAYLLESFEQQGN